MVDADAMQARWLSPVDVPCRLLLVCHRWLQQYSSVPVLVCTCFWVLATLVTALGSPPAVAGVLEACFEVLCRQMSWHVACCRC